MSTRITTACRRTLLAAAVITALVPVSSASAGRLLATGHDSDHHCSGRDSQVGQCSFFRSATDYVRGGAPNPSKPVLVLDRGALDVVRALDKAYGAGVVPRVAMDPRSAQFETAPITVDRYSAVIVASSRGDERDNIPQDLNEVTSTPDSDAINARAKDLHAFYNAGGGLFVNTGHAHGDQPGDPHFAFLPLQVAGATVAGPFRLTEVGKAAGFAYRAPGAPLAVDDVNCCETHNAFQMPAPDSPLKAVEVDRSGLAVTLLANTPNIAHIAPVKPTLVEQITKTLPSATQCVRRSLVAIKLTRPRGVRFRSAVVYANGRKVRVLKGSKITRKFAVRLRGNTTRVRIVITTNAKKKRKITVSRSFKACR